MKTNRFILMGNKMLLRFNNINLQFVIRFQELCSFEYFTSTEMLEANINK